MTETTAAATHPGPPPPLTDGGAAQLEWLRRMRAEEPVHRDEHGVFHIVRYDDVRRVASDPGVFSSGLNRDVLGAEDITRGNPAWTDPPDHRRLRALVGQAFTRTNVREYERRTYELGNALLDELDGQDRFDLVEKFVWPLPAMLIAELLGVPVSDRQLFLSYADKLASLQVGDPTDDEEGYGGMMSRVTGEIRGYLTEQYRGRLATPGDDLISKLAAAEDDGSRLDEDEVVNICLALLFVGHFSTNGLIGNMLLCLDEHPEVAARLRADRSLIPAAVEEVLRYRPSGTRFMRVTSQDTEVAGTPIPARSLVMLWFSSANRDERRFARPDEFDIGRTPNGHISFGHGIHFCVGAPLSRMEAAVSANLLFDRFADLRIESGDPLPFYEQGMWAPRRIPVAVRRA
ncbi:cytochrome P450 [Amycolatopsis sp. 195334CR]|uniref:cytochrome P450 n=1 Tax=Amycolatopsis sp. 195334CR TaxID=2814588 RepID=UPI001A8E2BCA|nr:cytochrome P450 [Amycolatopsis sp. 195334CR]MBN6042343.1 cytochrome P450 [Amycolatopsis sp. 195334CR]